MHDPITVEILVEQLKKLRIAFPSHAGTKTPEAIIETAEVYLDGLHGLTADALRAAVRVSIETEKFFPKVAELRALSWDWTRRNRADVSPADTGDPLWCARCQTRLHWVDRWRPKIDDLTRAPICFRDEFGVLYMQLERYERLLCRCASACAFWPEIETRDGDRVWMWMRRDQVSHLFGSPAARSGSSRIAFAAPMSDVSRGEPLPLPAHLAPQPEAAHA